ncbi:MAG: chemotaxis protein CheA [Defluviitaleaceae bacterium]|nr:chemotaxis protein CheA [Defluviitaleaceae bacterium]
MLEMFIFEMNTLIEQLEQTIVQSETEYNSDQINEIFRIMHTIKGSAAMMMFDNIAGVAHAVEDLFYYLREESPTDIDYPTLSDHVLEGADFVKAELMKIQDGEPADGDGSALSASIKSFLGVLKGMGAAPAGLKAEKAETAKPEAEAARGKADMLHRYKVRIHFEEGCEMENIRAYTLVHNLGDMAHEVSYVPDDIIDDSAIEIIRKNGFMLYFSSDTSYKKVHDHLSQTVYLKTLNLEELTDAPEEGAAPGAAEISEEDKAEAKASHDEAGESPAPKREVLQKTASAANEEASQAKKSSQAPAHMISVNVKKLDDLLNLMGELVISEAMVTQNSELEGLQLDSFHKDTRQLQKNINDLQGIILSMRMVPLSNTFYKMHRIVRDMCRQLDKDVQLDIVGEETEVDKNVIEHIADPIMHIIRNSIDHGVEKPADRKKAGKPEKARVLLEAKNSGGDVLIIIKDDGAGLNRDKILKKAIDNGLLKKPESEYTDKEIHQFIFLPGFSTNENVTAYSGRGVGMDVVTANLEYVGGTVIVDSTPGEGSAFTLKIPLTLAIIEGMSVLLAGARYTLPIVSIIKSFKAPKDKLFKDPNGNEMITERGEIYNIVRLHEFFGVEGAITNIEDGILIMLENNEQTICLLVDDLIGQQQVVVKSMPKYFKKVRGLSGCTLLGNGDISLIVDVAGLFDK